MTRAAAVLGILLGCSAGPSPDAPGRVHVTTRIVDAELYVDARPRAPLVDGMEVEVPPGRHRLEARRGRRVLASEPVDVRPGATVTRSLEEQPIEQPIPPRRRRRAG